MWGEQGLGGLSVTKSTHSAKTDVCFSVSRVKILCELEHCVDGIIYQAYSVKQGFSW